MYNDPLLNLLGQVNNLETLQSWMVLAMVITGVAVVRSVSEIIKFLAEFLSVILLLIVVSSMMKHGDRERTEAVSSVTVSLISALRPRKALELSQCIDAIKKSLKK